MRIRMHRSSTSTLVTLLMASVVLSACSDDGSPGSKAIARVGWIGDPHYANMSLLPEYSEVAEVQLNKFQLSQDELNALAAGDLDLASMGYVHFLRLLSMDVDVVALSGVSTGGTRIIVKEGVSVDSWEDLAELRLGIARGSTQDLQLQAALANNGVDATSIEFVVFTSASDMAVGLEQGSVDAVSIWEPQASQTIINGIGTDFKEIYPDSWGSNSILVARADYVEENPEAVEDIVDALYRASGDLSSDEDLWLQTALKYVPLPEDVVRMAIGNMGQDVTIYRDDLNLISELLSENGFIDSPVSSEKIDEHINIEALLEASGKTEGEMLGKEGE